MIIPEEIDICISHAVNGETRAEFDHYMELYFPPAANTAT